MYSYMVPTLSLLSAVRKNLFFKWITHSLPKIWNSGCCRYPSSRMYYDVFTCFQEFYQFIDFSLNFLFTIKFLSNAQDPLIIVWRQTIRVVTTHFLRCGIILLASVKIDGGVLRLQIAWLVLQTVLLLFTRLLSHPLMNVLASVVFNESPKINSMCTKLICTTQAFHRSNVPNQLYSDRIFDSRWVVLVKQSRNDNCS